jgi:hypothetical protein
MDAVHENMAPRFAAKILRDNHALVTSKSLDTDYKLLCGAFYLKSFCCAPGDLTILRNLTREMEEHAQEGKGFIEWSKHHKYEAPDAVSPTFRAVIAKMATYFDVEVYATRLNFYADGSEWFEQEKKKKKKTRKKKEKKKKKKTSDLVSAGRYGVHCPLLFVILALAGKPFHHDSHAGRAFFENGGQGWLSFSPPPFFCSLSQK